MTNCGLFFATSTMVYENIYRQGYPNMKQFERALLILSDRDIPLITRELIYTGITRARKDVDIWAGEDLLNRAI